MNKKEREKMEKLKQKLKEKTKLADDYLRQLKYLQADFENYRKRMEKERKGMIKYANEEIIKDLLEIIDDFERAIGSLKGKEIAGGLSLILNRFKNILKRYGLKEIKAVGNKFDPYYHEALLKVKTKGEKNIVVEELQKGYILNSKVIRHSKVKVSS